MTPRQSQPSFSELVIVPEVELADVERRLVEAVGIRVGNDHLGDRRAVEDRTDRAVVLVADVVEDEPLAAVEADAQVPLLPAHRVALDREARPSGWRCGSAGRRRAADPLGPVLAVVVGQRDRFAVLEVDDLAAC